MILVASIFYIIGGIPFGLILTKLCGVGDLRKIGSGNIGATNVLRTGSKRLAALTLLLDMAKGAVPLLLLNNIEWIKGDSLSVIELQWWLGLILVIGHCFSVWLRFRGGKGVATTIGVYMGINPIFALWCIIIWLVMAWRFNYSSLAAICAVTISPFLIFLYYRPIDIIVLLPLFIISIIVLFRHRDNINRLLTGTEGRIMRDKQ